MDSDDSDSSISMLELSDDSDSIILVDYIHVLDKPNSSFSYNVLEDCEDNNLINFSNNSIGGITYLWDFGNGDTSLLENPSYSYSFAGNFPVTLVVENGLGCIDDSTVNSISIYPTPIINATSDTLLICDSRIHFPIPYYRVDLLIMTKTIIFLII